MSTRISPTVRRRRLALELRRLRTEAGITAAEVAKELACSPGKISQMETGRVSITVPDTRAMLDLYGVTGDGRDTLVELARTTKQRGWWLPYGDVMHPWFQSFVGLETESSVVRTYRAELVPGLLQTEDYYRAVLASELEPWSAEEVATLLELRAARQAILGGEDGPTLWFVLNESVLRRLVGSRSVMRDQLDRLVEIGKRKNVSIQVLPFAVGAHPGMNGSFTVLEFAEAAGQEVVCVEHLGGAHYLEDPEEVGRHRFAFEQLTAKALSKSRSAALIKDLVKGL